MAKPVAMTSCLSIDWLELARQAIDRCTDQNGNTDIPTIQAIANAQLARACIAMHNAEREQGHGGTVSANDFPLVDGPIDLPEQPQPFDCEEVWAICNGGCDLAEDSTVYKEEISALRDYVRSLNIKVKE